MTSIHRFLSLVTALAIWAGASAVAEEGRPGRPLLSAAVDERQMTTLEGNTRPEAKLAADDRQLVADSLLLEHVQLQLKRSRRRSARSRLLSIR